ncbi:hypothetical protein FRC03_003625 [Tulasnella sp. 419]|nr:hypothetical protein FRC03_003625 [Tulasnella sp. 419]
MNRDYRDTFPPYFWPIVDGEAKKDDLVYCAERLSQIAPASGHFSIVKRCYILNRLGDPTGEEVAVKILLPNFSDRTLVRSVSKPDQLMRAMSRRLWREREIHLKLNHENVAPLMGFFEDPKMSSWCLVTPWYRNGTVRMFANKPRNISERFRLLLESALGLAYLHSEGIVHGDIKSTNVLVDQEKHARIIDFGVSYSVQAKLPDGSSSLAAAQRWMAPELHTPQQYQHLEHPEIPTFKSDVWSFGCLSLEIYSDADPYMDVEREKVFLRINPSVGPKLLPGSPERYPEVTDNGLWTLCSLCWDYTVETRPNIDSVIRFLRDSSGLKNGNTNSSKSSI